MKRIALSILFLLILCVSVALAALTKTTAVDVIDDWQLVAAATLDVGNAKSISSAYDAILYVEIVYAHDNAQDGVGVIVEGSYGDDNWTLLADFTTEGINPSGSDTLNGEEAAGQTIVTLDARVTFDTPGQKWFIVDGTVANSESVRTKATSGGAQDLELCHDLLRTHADVSVVWDVVVERVIPIPAAFAYVRVIINNTDANAPIYYTTRLSQVTGL